MMNWVDLVITILLIFFALEGLGRSLIGEVLDLISFVLAFLLSLRFYSLVSAQLEVYFQLPRSFANVLGFITVWFVVESVLFAMGRLLLPRVYHFVRLPKLTENILAMVPAFLKGLVFIAIFLVLIATFPIQPKIKKDVLDSKIGSKILSYTYKLETPFKNIFGGLSQDSLTFITVRPRSDERINIGFQNNKFFFDEKLEFAMVDLVNKERVSRGLNALTYDPALRVVARNHSADMFKRGYFSHFSPEGKSVADRADEQGVSYMVIGENLAYAPSLELAHNGLMDSPGHRANILSADFNKVGIGAANGAEYGVMFTQVFSN